MGVRRWWILAALVVATLPLSVDVVLVAVALPDLARHLPASRLQAAGAIAGFPLVLAVLIGPAGSVGARLGVRRPLLAGLALALAGMVGAGYATSPESLLAARAGVGVGAAAALPAALRLVQAAFAPAEHLRAVAIWAGFTGLAVAAAGVLGGLLVGRSGWRSVFGVEAGLLALGLLLLVLVLPAVAAGATVPGRGWSGPAGPVAVFGFVGAAVAVSARLQAAGLSPARAGAVLLVGAVSLSAAARAASRLVERSSPRIVQAAALGLLGLSSAAAAGVEGGGAATLLFAALGAGAALALAAAGPGGPADPVLRAFAVGLGILVMGSLDPRTGLLAGAGVAALGALAVSLGRDGPRAARQRPEPPPRATAR